MDERVRTNLRSRRLVLLLSTSRDAKDCPMKFLIQHFLANRYRPPAADDPMVTDSGGGGENPWLPQGRKLCVLMQCCSVAFLN